MAVQSNEIQANPFWQSRQCYLILNDESLAEKKATMISDDEDRKRTFDNEYEEFLSKNQDKFVAANVRNGKLEEIVKKTTILDKVFVVELL